MTFLPNSSEIYRACGEFKSELVRHLSWEDSRMHIFWVYTVEVNDLTVSVWLIPGCFCALIKFLPQRAVLKDHFVSLHPHNLSSCSHVCGIREVSCVGVIPIIQVRWDKQNAGHQCPFLDFRRHHLLQHVLYLKIFIFFCLFLSKSSPGSLSDMLHRELCI